MAVRRPDWTWISLLVVTGILYLTIQAVALCKSTTTQAAGSGVVLDFYDGTNVDVTSCSCSVTIPSTSNFLLSMTSYQKLGISGTSGCGSEVQVTSGVSGSQTMTCNIFGSINMQIADNAAVTLTKEPTGDTRYCMLMSTNPSYIMNITCEAALPTTTQPSTTTTTTTTTTQPTTTTTTTTTTTQPTTTTTKRPTTTMKAATTTGQPTTTTSTAEMTTTTTQPITTTQPPSTPTTIRTSTPVITTTTTQTPASTATTQLTTTTTTSHLPTVTSQQSSSTTPTRPVGQQEEEREVTKLSILIPVIVGAFFLLLVVVVVVQLVRTRKKKQQLIQRQEPDMEKFKFNRILPNNGIFHHPSEMKETTKYDSKEDLHGHTDRNVSVTNPIYVHDEDYDHAYQLPNITDEEVAHFTSANNAEAGKVTSGYFQTGGELVHDNAPLYAVVNKTGGPNTSYTFSNTSDSISKSSGDASSTCVLNDNERNLRQEESFYY